MVKGRRRARRFRKSGKGLFDDGADQCTVLELEGAICGHAVARHQTRGDDYLFTPLWAERDRLLHGSIFAPRALFRRSQHEYKGAEGAASNRRHRNQRHHDRLRQGHLHLDQ
jgi:hypothetical protein